MGFEPTHKIFVNFIHGYYLTTTFAYRRICLFNLLSICQTVITYFCVIYKPPRPLCDHFKITLPSHYRLFTDYDNHRTAYIYNLQSFLAFTFCRMQNTFPGGNGSCRTRTYNRPVMSRMLKPIELMILGTL